MNCRVRLCHLAPLVLLAACGGSEFKSDRTYAITVELPGKPERNTYQVLGKDITKNSNGSWVLRDASWGTGNDARTTATIHLPSTAMVEVHYIWRTKR